MNIKKEAIDQSSHFLAAMIIITPVIVFHNWYATTWAGFVVGLIRELTEESPKVTLKAFKNVFTSEKSMMDITAWILGGLATGFLFT